MEGRRELIRIVVELMNQLALYIAKTFSPAPFDFPAETLKAEYSHSLIDHPIGHSAAEGSKSMSSFFFAARADADGFGAAAPRLPDDHYFFNPREARRIFFMSPLTTTRTCGRQPESFFDS